MKSFVRVAAAVAFILATVVQIGSPQEQEAADQWLKQPIDDRIFQTYLDFFTYDQNIPFELRVIDVQEREGIKKTHLSFQSTPGVRVFANHYLLSASVSQKAPAVILLHGGVPKGKDSGSIRVLAELLVRDGWNVLAIDMQYYGERSTDLLTKYSEREKHDQLYNQPSVYLTWITQTIKDISRSFDLLVKQRSADARRIGLIGFSRGAQIAPIAGGVERRLAAVVLLHGGHFDALERGHLPAACPANYIGRISPRPLFMINGTHDNDYVRDTSVLPLYRLAKPPKLIRWTDTGHGVLTDEDRSALLQWLRENLK